MRQHLGVVMERIVFELQGLSCIPLEEMPSPRKQILTSRSSGEKLTQFEDLPGQPLVTLLHVRQRNYAANNWQPPF
jgi:hypothetical protein